MFKNTAALLGIKRRESTTSAHSRQSVASFYSESDYDGDYHNEEDFDSDESSLTEDNIYLTSASVCSSTAMDEDGVSSRRGLGSKNKISLGSAMGSCVRLNMSSHEIQHERGSRLSLFGDQFEETTAGAAASSSRQQQPNNNNNNNKSSSILLNMRTKTSNRKLESRNTSPSFPPVIKPASSSSLLSVNNNNNNNNVKVTLNEFDLDHLKIQNEVCDDEDSCEEGEAWMIKKLEKNSPELYWLQLTTGIENPHKLIGAMQNNIAVRNVTVYSRVLESLSGDKKKDLVDAICQLPNLKTLIVFQDCGSLFLDPLIRYGPNLTRLTLYKLDFAGKSILHKLILLVSGLPTLQELNLEKYHAVDTAKLLRAISGVVLSTNSLKTLCMTPARKVKVSSDGLLALIKAFNQNKTVKTLALQGSESGMNLKCVEELASILEDKNTTLGDFKLTGFWRSEDDFWKQFPSKLTDQIQFYLNLNKSGVRNLQLDVNATLGTLQNAMVTNRENIDVLFFLLRNNPILVDVLLA